ncbi:uncharacterized protein (TIGR02646 family) [Pantoea alhagi]|uniref:HNH endonuclease n=1 Tax=Mixta sp. BE291 TaxID=3158787 RepID=UPI00285D1DCD|nr:uncharacterized protein (TIGR02646 family) [Pantoea alhagi]
MQSEFSAVCKKIKDKGKRDFIESLLCLLCQKAQEANVNVWNELYKLKLSYGNSTIKGSYVTKAIRDYLIERQNSRCCYCKRYILNSSWVRQVEHILPTAHYPRFSLTMNNLAVACAECNNAKSNDIWWQSINPAGPYPDMLLFKDAFHHNMHKYDEHVRWFRYSNNKFSFSIYAGLTAPGRKLCSDLLEKVVQVEILNICDDGMQAALDKINLYNTNNKTMPGLETFLRELQKKLIA